MVDPAPNGRDLEKMGSALAVSPDLSTLKQAAARLYAQGFTRAQIARTLIDHLQPNTDRPLEQRLSNARNKLRSWERQGKFLDFIWQLGLLKANLQMPLVIDGVLGKAKRGRVDAARLLMEVTGRHNPRGDVQATSVVIQFGGDIPRPSRRADVELEPIDEEDVA